MVANIPIANFDGVLEQGRKLHIGALQEPFECMPVGPLGRTDDVERPVEHDVTFYANIG